MAAARRKIRPEDIHGLKYFKALQGLIERLHFVGTQRDKAGNRDLHMDQYCSLILLWFFSPIVDSLRGLQQAGTLDKVRKNFGVGRASLGSHGLPRPRERRCAAIDCTHSSRCCVVRHPGST